MVRVRQRLVDDPSRAADQEINHRLSPRNMAARRLRRPATHTLGPAQVAGTFGGGFFALFFFAGFSGFGGGGGSGPRSSETNRPPTNW